MSNKWFACMVGGILAYILFISAGTSNAAPLPQTDRLQTPTQTPEGDDRLALQQASPTAGIVLTFAPSTATPPPPLVEEYTPTATATGETATPPPPLVEEYTPTATAGAAGGSPPVQTDPTPTDTLLPVQPLTPTVTLAPSIEPVIPTRTSTRLPNSPTRTPTVRATQMPSPRAQQSSTPIQTRTGVSSATPNLGSATTSPQQPTLTSTPTMPGEQQNSELPASGQEPSTVWQILMILGLGCIGLGIGLKTVDVK